MAPRQAGAGRCSVRAAATAPSDGWREDGWAPWSTELGWASCRDAGERSRDGAGAGVQEQRLMEHSACRKKTRERDK
jgi:hypothetical protein